MAHFPKPFFRAPHGLWYVQIEGKQVNLGPDKGDAFKAYYALMQQRADTSETATPVTTQQLVVTIVDEFLDWCQKAQGT